MSRLAPLPRRRRPGAVARPRGLQAHVCNFGGELRLPEARVGFEQVGEVPQGLGAGAGQRRAQLVLGGFHVAPGGSHVDGQSLRVRLQYRQLPLCAGD